MFGGLLELLKGLGGALQGAGSQIGQGFEWLGQPEQQGWRDSLGKMAGSAVGGDQDWGAGLGQQIGGALGLNKPSGGLAAAIKKKHLPTDILGAVGQAASDNALGQIGMGGENAGISDVARARVGAPQQQDVPLAIGKMTPPIAEGRIPGQQPEADGYEAHKVTGADKWKKDASGQLMLDTDWNPILDKPGENLDLKTPKNRLKQGLKAGLFGALQGLAQDGNIGSGIGGGLAAGISGAYDPLRSKQYMYEQWDKRAQGGERDYDRQQQMKELELEGAQQKIAIGKMQPDVINAQLDEQRAQAEQRRALAQRALEGPIETPLQEAQRVKAEAQTQAIQQKTAAGPPVKPPSVSQQKWYEEQIRRQLDAEEGSVAKIAADSLQAGNRDVQDLMRFIPDPFARSLVDRLLKEKPGEKPTAGSLMDDEKKMAVKILEDAKKKQLADSIAYTQRIRDQAVRGRMTGANQGSGGVGITVRKSTGYAPARSGQSLRW